MIKCTLPNEETQAQRLKIKTINQQMQNLAREGAGLTSWESQVLVDLIDEVYFQDPDLRQTLPGQLRYCCVKVNEPAGKPLKDCQMTTVVLTLFSEDDTEQLPFTEKARSVELRQRRLLRISDEAREQGGLLSQEDLGHLLMSDVRTIRRDIAALKKQEIVVPTRGTVKDIGPGVTHRALAIRLWLEGAEPTEVRQRIHHSLKATENYIEKFKRVAYLRRKGFTEFELSRTIGISVAAARTFIGLYEEFRNKSFFKRRMEEIELIGKEFNLAESEKKDSPSSNSSTSKRQGKR